MRLFAESGVAGTPITKIEEAAGLAPGSGAFYRHFRSKDELFEAAVADAAAVTRIGNAVEALWQLPLEEQVPLVAQALWAFYDGHRDLVIVLTRDVGHRPANYGHGADQWPGSGMAELVAWLRGLAERGDLEIDDPAATVLVLVDALTNYWLQRAVEDPIPYGVEGDRFIAAWTNLVLNLRPRR